MRNGLKPFPEYRKRERQIMAADFTVYENWYKYMSGVLNQIQGGVGYQGSTYSNRASLSGQSFTETFLEILQRMGRADAKETVSGNMSKAGNASRTAVIQTGSESMDAIFAEAAEQYNVPLNLLKAIGKAESGFDANAVSPAGAQGVMQLMPATARSLGVEDPFDARSNIMGGARYIAEKLNQYNGDIDLALAAYNAGSGNVAKYGGVPPFAETRNYISRIKGYMNGDLTTGKTVEVQAAAGADEERQQTEGTSFSLSRQNAQYMMDMMRLQMLSRVSSLSMLDTSSEDSSGSNFFL